jgi:hypothetical protein
MGYSYLKKEEDRGEKWPKHCMHMWINEKKKEEEKKFNTYFTPYTKLISK